MAIFWPSASALGGALADAHRQNTILQAGIDVGGIGIGRQPETTRECAILAFAEIPGFSLFFALGAFLALYRDHAVIDAQVDIFLGDAGQFHHDAIGLIVTGGLGCGGHPIGNPASEGPERFKQARPIAKRMRFLNDRTSPFSHAFHHPQIIAIPGGVPP